MIDCEDYIKAMVKNSKSKQRTVAMIQFREIIRKLEQETINGETTPEALLS